MAPRAIDPKRFPALSEYVSKLPQGLSSYPEAQSKGILLKSAIAPHYFHATWKDLPAELVSVMKSPPLPTSWVSTVLTDSVFCVVADTFYPSDEAMLQWSYDRTIRLANLPMYTALTRLAGLERFLKMAAKVHALFQRGTDVTVEVKGNRAEVVLAHAPHLHGRLNHLSNEGAFRATLESAGALDVQMKLVETTPTRARYEASWRG